MQYSIFGCHNVETSPSDADILISNEYGSEGRGNVFGTLAKDTTPLAEFTVTPETVPDATDKATGSLLASVTCRVYNEGYDCPATSNSVVSPLVIVGGKFAIKIWQIIKCQHVNRTRIRVMHLTISMISFLN